ncbi:MAG: hypothetical protein CVV02_04870 [Firmicutes bacterium HGW-Firmicutes-7]|nr:MAG: hypothetical protein CVV02_04870 [Firmicutes bacterium HGW-Firmicutes-7]
MIIEEKFLEMRGMRRQEIIDYFISLDFLACDLSTFVGEHLRIEVGEEVFVKMGSLSIPATSIKFSGEKDVVEKVLYWFRLRFLTAGG